MCTAHAIEARDLFNAVLADINRFADMAVNDERAVIKIYYKFIGFVGELHITPTKRWTALPAKHCTVCGIEYVPGSGILKYCPACAKRIQREKSNESKRRSREQKRMACIELSAKNDRLVAISGLDDLSAALLLVQGVFSACAVRYTRRLSLVERIKAVD
jgi:uncharacterized Zn finger protein (UPF0148 family)